VIPGLSKYITREEGVSGKIKKFEVYEVPKYLPSGRGGWYWFLVEREGKTTHQLIGEIASSLGIGERDVGYAGLKDKNARTFQWFSTPVDPSSLPLKIHVIGKCEKKIKIGNLLGNWFRIVMETSEPRRVAEILQKLQDGVPNGFGPQRFSRANHVIGKLLIEGKRERAIEMMKRYRIPLKKHFFIFMESAYTSYLFNKVLNMRIPIKEKLDGDIVGRFGPTGPIYGRKVPLASGFQGEIERKVLEEENISLEMFRNKGRRRPLFVPFHGLSFRIRSKEIEFKFFLPKGSFATMVLREVLKENFTWPFLSFSFSSS